MKILNPRPPRGASAQGKGHIKKKVLLYMPLGAGCAHCTWEPRLEATACITACSLPGAHMSLISCSASFDEACEARTCPFGRCAVCRAGRRATVLGRTCQSGCEERMSALRCMSRCRPLPMHCCLAAALSRSSRLPAISAKPPAVTRRLLTHHCMELQPCGTGSSG